MVHIAAILLGILVLAAIGGFVYVIVSVIEHFGFDAEDVIITIIASAAILMLTWVLGTIVIEAIGLF